LDSNTHLYLAVDQGGHASRASLFAANGQIVGSAIIPVQTLYPAPERVEHDPEELFGSVQSAIDGAIRDANSSQVIAAGLATQRSSIVCWDKNSGSALSPVLSWQDRRTANWIQQFSAHAFEIRQRTGLPLSPYYGVSKLRWCWDHIPSVRDAWNDGRLAWGPLASYLCYRLTKERTIAVDPANASRTLLWNLDSSDWDPSLAKLFSIQVSALPPCTMSRHVWGSLDHDRRDIPLTLVTGDQSAALFARGEPKSGDVMINLGTGAFLQQALDHRPPQSSLLTSMAYQDQSRRIYALEGTVNGAGSALTWIASQLGIDEKVIIRDLPEWLSSINQPPLFLNGVAGLGTPFLRPLFSSRFIGDGSVAEKCVAVCESIVFLLQVNLEEMSHSVGPARRIIISGGLSNLEGICQRLADLSGIMLLRLDNHEATIQGLARLLIDSPVPMIDEITGVKFFPRDMPQLKARYVAWHEELEAALLN
jgi:glycerol kinase